MSENSEEKAKNNTKLFPAVLEKVRKQRHLSKAALADKIDVSQMTVRRYETGEYTPDKDTYSAIALVLHSKELFEPWAHDWLKGHPNEGLTVEELSKAMMDKIYEVGLRKYITSVGRKASLAFIEPYFYVTQGLLSLNKQGVDKAYEQIQLLLKIPEYRKNSFAAKGAYQSDMSGTICQDDLVLSEDE